MKTIFNINNNFLKHHSEFMPEPVVIRVVNFNEDAASQFAKQMSEAHNTGQSIIPIVIDSYGGEVYALLSMIAEIQASRLPVATIAVGKAMSCGSILLSCGNEGMRYMAPTAQLMIHEMRAGYYAKLEDQNTANKHYNKLHKQVFEMMAKNIGKNKRYIFDMIHEANHSEIFLTPAQAKKHNIIQHIHVPELSVNVNVNYEMK